MSVISFTPENFENFKSIYRAHADDPDAVFEFQVHKFLVGYAKYLIEYVETQNPQTH